MQPDQLAALDAFIAERPKRVSRPEAIRELIAAQVPSAGRAQPTRLDDRGAIEARVLKVALPKATLRCLSKEERALLFLLGSAANQIAMFQKLVVFSSNEDPSDEPERSLSAAQTQMLARLAIGVLAETWQLIHGRFVQRPIGREYRARLNTGGLDALKTLTRHFGKSGLLPRLRNKNIFHFPDDDAMEAAFESASVDSTWDNDWNVFLARSTVNVFFFASDVLALHAIHAASGEPDLVSTQNRVMGEVRLVGDAMSEFIYAFFAAIWQKHFGPELEAVACADTSAAPDLFRVWIPFFVNVEAPSAPR
jgi:hypothetical protein